MILLPHLYSHLTEMAICVPESPSAFVTKFYQELLKEKSDPRLKGNRKGIIVKGKEFYIPILSTFPTR